VFQSVSQQYRSRRKKLIEAARFYARGDLCLKEFLGLSADEPKSEIETGLALMGLYVDGSLELGADEFWLWPENEEAFLFWLELQTQWNVGNAGPVGLNYAGVDVCLRRGDIRPRDRNRIFRLMQAMERAALDEWAQRRNS